MPIAFAMLDLPPALLQFLGSLVAIVALAALAWKLGLGPTPRLAGENHARQVADEVSSGFDPEHIAIDRDGGGAILSDEAGRIMVLRIHGSHFAGRILTPEARAMAQGDELLVSTGEKRFGDVKLKIDDASAWMKAIEAIKSPANA